MFFLLSRCLDHIWRLFKTRSGNSLGVLLSDKQYMNSFICCFWGYLSPKDMCKLLHYCEMSCIYMSFIVFQCWEDVFILMNPPIMIIVDKVNITQMSMDCYCFRKRLATSFSETLKMISAEMIKVSQCWSKKLASLKDYNDHSLVFIPMKGCCYL